MPMNDLHALAAEARRAAWELAACPLERRNAALCAMSRTLTEEREAIFAANAEDLRAAQEENLAAPLLKRLYFGEEKLQAVLTGLQALAELPDPLGQTTLSRELTPGLCLYRVTCPIGVVGVIFESRPDALVQIASLCLKSGNAALLKGGREAQRTNAALAHALTRALTETGLPAAALTLLATREDVAAMLREDTLIDLIIPRGSNAFVRWIMDNSRIPVLGHSDGLCHLYADRAADPAMALRLIVDSKTQNVSVCNALETLLVHRELAPRLLPPLAHALTERGVELRGDARTQALIDCKAAVDADWDTEYLDLILSIRMVDNLEEAVAHINRHGSHHTDCIVTDDQEAAAEFLRRVDSAGVYHNVATRFADGFVYGFGAEVGIATGKLHARGPMGLEGLTTYKYKLLGSGQTMAEMKSGARSYTHRDLGEACPL